MTRNLACALAMSFVGACNAGPDRPGSVYMPEMFQSVPYDSHDPSPVLPNGLTLQAPPEGTIPQGFTPVHYSPGPEEAAAAGAELTNPFERSDAVLARGRFAFETWCAVCHGMRGAGDGTVVPPFPNPPSLATDRARGLPDGRLFHIITRGQNLMPSYAVQVHEDDRWKIIHYIRELQGPAPAATPAVDAGAPVPEPPPDAGATPEAAATEQPASQQSGTELPATERPATEPPGTEQPATEAPAPEQPATEAPAPEQPATGQPRQPRQRAAADPSAEPVRRPRPAPPEETQPAEVTP